MTSIKTCRGSLTRSTDSISRSRWIFGCMNLALLGLGLFFLGFRFPGSLLLHAFLPGPFLPVSSILFLFIAFLLITFLLVSSVPGLLPIQRNIVLRLHLSSPSLSVCKGLWQESRAFRSAIKARCTRASIWGRHCRDMQSILGCLTGLIGKKTSGTWKIKVPFLVKGVLELKVVSMQGRMKISENLIKLWTFCRCPKTRGGLRSRKHSYRPGSENSLSCNE